MEKIYTIAEVCRLLHVKRRAVHYWIAGRKLKAFHLGGRRLTRIWERDLKKFIVRGGRDGRKKPKESWRSAGAPRKSEGRGRRPAN